MKLSIWMLVPLLMLAIAGCTEEDERKPPGSPCKGNTDCADQVCHNKKCLPPVQDMVGLSEACEGDYVCFSQKCESGTCVPGTAAKGDACIDNSECAAGWCTGGVCGLPPTEDGTVPTPDFGVDSTPTPDMPVPDMPVHDMPVHDMPVHDMPVDMKEAGPTEGGPEAGCISGACNDGDDKTCNDTCQAGVCKGTPVDCSNLLPSSCHEYNYDGSCKCEATKVQIKPGYCSIKDAAIPPNYSCYAKGPIPNTCQACDPNLSQTSLVAYAGKGCVTTVAGTGSVGWTDGPTNQATFSSPMALALDESKKRLYIADNKAAHPSYHTGAKIRYIDLTTKTVHTLVGPPGSTVNPTGACQDTQASPKKDPFFKHIEAMILHPTSKNLLVADNGCYAVRSIDTTKNDAVTTVAGQLGVSGQVDGAATTTATLGSPRGLAITPKGNAIYIADHWKLRLLSGGTVTTVLNSCSPECTRITYAAQTELYSAWQNGAVISQVNALTKSQYLYAGSTSGYQDGPRLTAKFSAYLNPVYVGGSTPTLYVAGGANHLLRKVDITSGVVSTLAGTSKVKGSADGAALKATFNNPMYIAVASNGVVYIADVTNYKIRKYTPK